jgi:metal-dependent amidase/aminoacylase/carboxypeptidase family protein
VVDMCHKKYKAGHGQAWPCMSDDAPVARTQMVIGLSMVNGREQDRTGNSVAVRHAFSIMLMLLDDHGRR